MENKRHTYFSGRLFSKTYFNLTVYAPPNKFGSPVLEGPLTESPTVVTRLCLTSSWSL